MITLIVYCLTILTILVISAPTIICFLLKKILKLDIISFKQYTINKFKSFILKVNTRDKIWGISDFILYIPNIKIAFNIKNFKIIIEIENMEAFLLHDNSELHKVKIIQGLMQPNLVANFFHFIIKNTQYRNQINREFFKNFYQKIKTNREDSLNQKVIQEKLQKKNRSHILTLFLGSFHFLVMMFLQFFQIRFVQNTINFVSSIPSASEQVQQNGHDKLQRSYLSFSSALLIKRSLLLLRSLSEQTLKIQLLSAKVMIINHFQQQIQIVCPKFQIINWSHAEQPMLKGRQFFIGMKIPFTLQISQSFKSLQYIIRVKSLEFNTIPRDYETILYLIKSFSFSLKAIEKLFIGNLHQDIVISNKSESQQPQRQNSFCVQISSVSLVIHSLFQASIDDKEAAQYLSNISQARFSLQGISFKSRQFKIEQSILKLSKFRNESQGKQNQKFNTINESPMILIPNIVFQFNEKSTKVSHNPTQLFCGRQQLALLGKLFRLINDRMRFQQLNPHIYMRTFNKILDFNRSTSILRPKNSNNQSVQKASSNFYHKNILVDFFTYFCFIQRTSEQQNTSPEQQTDQSFKKEKSEQYISNTSSLDRSQFLYEPSSLTFRLLIQNLQHSLFLANCSYKQIMKSEEFQHILCVPSLDLNYSKTKEFSIKELKMIFRQISTFQQLALFVQSTKMAQTEQTLIQYLNGWIVLKKLLQINGSSGVNQNLQDSQSQNHLNSNQKLFKKTITIRKLELEYEKQQILIKKFQLQQTTLPNNKVSRLYFSLDRCQFNTKLTKNIGYTLKKTVSTNKPQERFKTPKKPSIFNVKTKIQNNTKNQQEKQKIQQSDNKGNVQVTYNLFSFQSLTININLHNFRKKIGKRKAFNIQKQKSLIHLKSPQFSFPHFDISKKILKVFKSYQQLQPHLNAYIKNTTQNQFLKIKRNIQDFLIQPDCLLVKVTNIGVLVQQQPMNTHLQNYHRFIRQFMSKYDYKQVKGISQIELISFLNKNKKESNLCKLSIKQISCEILPLQNISNTFKQSVNQWIQGFKQNLQFSNIQSRKSIRLTENTQIRLRKVQAAQYKFGLKNLQFFMRDYPEPIINFTNFNFKTICVKTSNIFNLKNYFFIGDIKFNRMTVNAGLNMLSGFMQLNKKVLSYVQIFNNIEKTSDFITNRNETILKKKRNRLMQDKKTQLGYQPWWHILFNCSQWKFRIHKQPTIINLYTGTTPYDKQCFQIILGNIQCKSELPNTSLMIKELEIKLLQDKILQLKDLKMVLQIVYDQSRHFSISTNISASNVGKIICNKKTVQYISSIKQLRNDWLIIYGIQTEKSYEDDQMLRKKQRLNYLELLNITANKMIQKDQQNVSILSVIKDIKIKVKIFQFGLIITNFQQSLQLGIQDFRFDYQVVAIQKINNQWHTLKSNLQVQKIWGALPVNQNNPLQNSTRITENSDENQENVFLAARKLKLSFNKYRKLNDISDVIIFAKKYMVIESIKLAVSLRIKKIIEKLILSFSPDQLKRQFEQKTKIVVSDESNLTAVQRLKSIVWKIMRINKLKRRRKSALKTFKFLGEVQTIEIVLRSNKSSIIVESRKKVRLYVSKIFRQNDQNFQNPIAQILLKLIDVEISLIQSSKNWIANLLSQRYKQTSKPSLKKLRLSYSQSLQLFLEVQTEDKQLTIGKLILQNGSIQLTQKTKSILIELIEFLIIFANTKEKKKIQYKKAHQKFNQLQNNGRDFLRTKIQAAYNNIANQNNEQVALKWLFLIKNTDIQLVVPIQQKIKFSIDAVSFLTISKPFIKILSKEIKMELNIFNNDKIERKFQVNDLTILNLFQKQESAFRKILVMNHNDEMALYVTMQSFVVNPLSSIVWDYFRQIKIHINPIKFRVTQQLYKKLYEFLFPQSIIVKQNALQTTNKQIPQNYEDKFIPDLIKKLEIDEVKIQVWYQTQSLLKRMEGISVGLKSYEIQKCFLTKKQLFDEWINFVLRQMAGQIFNVLGQKLFGSSQNT